MGVATIGGARANWLDKRTGSLTPGKEADVILLAANAINVMPLNHAYGAIVLGMDTSNVDTAFVGGRAKKTATSPDTDGVAARLYAAAPERPSYAFVKAAMSSFFIVSIAAMARLDFSGSFDCSISSMTSGTTCHDRP